MYHINYKKTKMKNKFNIGQSVTFKTKIFGQEKTKTNTIKYIEEINGEIVYFISGIGQSLGISLNGKEDCFEIREKNIIN